MAIIGVYGKARSGKNTVCEYLSIYYNYYPAAFAAPLKQACISAFGLDYRDVYSEEGKKKINPFWGVTHRQILQFVGTELYREGMENLLPGIGSNFWLRRADLEMEKIQKEEGRHVNFSFSDVRFDNEIEWVLSHPDSVVIHLVRDSAGAIGGIEGHASEADVDLSKYGDKIVRIENNSSLPDLYSAVNHVVHSQFYE